MRPTVSCLGWPDRHSCLTTSSAPNLGGKERQGPSGCVLAPPAANQQRASVWSQSIHRDANVAREPSRTGEDDRVKETTSASSLFRPRLTSLAGAPSLPLPFRLAAATNHHATPPDEVRSLAFDRHGPVASSSIPPFSSWRINPRFAFPASSWWWWCSAPLRSALLPRGEGTPFLPSASFGLCSSSRGEGMLVLGVGLWATALVVFWGRFE